jgi:protoheme IX farnesyltransferase|tara:strand:+ start:6815 stop:8671 length:1857 start_codon:yes stop_codon:yes gene_type:complete
MTTEKNDYTTLFDLSGVGSGFKTILLITLCLLFGLITLGGIVRVTDSGLGCPDWPLCYGQFIPPLQDVTYAGEIIEVHKIWIEWSHRTLAAITGFPILLVTILAWWKYRKFSLITVPATIALILLIFQVVLGAITVLRELPPEIVTTHLSTAQFIFATLLFMYVILTNKIQPLKDKLIIAKIPNLLRWSIIGAATSFIILISGSYVVGAGAGTSCPNWPLCDNTLLPQLNIQWLHMFHRVIVVLGTITIAIPVIYAYKINIPKITFPGLLVGTFLLAQIFIGALNPASGFHPVFRVLHLSLASALWLASMYLLTITWMYQKQTNLKSEFNLIQLLSDYFELSKPLIILLLLLSALTGMIIAEQGLPQIHLIATVLVAGALASAGANAINNFMDRDIDTVMSRTKSRPVAGSRVSPTNALIFGVVLNVISFVAFWTIVNLLSALLTLGATLFYVFIYTLWLKRTSTQNIVIGGAAGALPPIIGWAAVQGSIGLPSLYLFAIIFFWTPPHFWALSILLEKDYANANIPMLNVVMGIEETRKFIMMHSIILVALTILFYTVPQLGLFYLVSALILDVYFLYLGIKLWQSQDHLSARKLYLYSLLYLMLLLIAVMISSGFGI